MARKKDDEGDLFEASPDEIDSVLAGLPSQDTTINLWRTNPQGAPAYVAEFSPSDFSLDAIKNTYGGGKYKIVAKANGEVRISIFTIDGEPKNGTPRNIYKKYIGGKLVFSKPEDADVIVSDTARGLRTAELDGNFSSLLLSELRSLRETIQHPPESRETIKKDFLEEMMLFKNLFAPAPQNPNQDFSKYAIELIKQGMEVATMSENGGSPWMMLLDKVLPTVQEALKMVSVQQARTPTVSGQTYPPPQPKIEAPLTGFDAIAPELQNYLPTFIRAASLGTDPAILIDMTMPNIQSGEQTNAVIHWLESDAWLSDLVKLHPAISAQAAWWNDYRTGLLDALKNPQEVGLDEVN